MSEKTGPFEEVHNGITFTVIPKKNKPTDPQDDQWYATVEFLVTDGSDVTIKPYHFLDQTWNSPEDAIKAASAWARKHIDDGLPN